MKMQRMVQLFLCRLLSSVWHKCGINNMQKIFQTQINKQTKQDADCNYVHFI